MSFHALGTKQKKSIIGIRLILIQIIVLDYSDTGTMSQIQSVRPSLFQTYIRTHTCFKRRRLFL